MWNIFNPFPSLQSFFFDIAQWLWLEKKENVPDSFAILVYLYIWYNM